MADLSGLGSFSLPALAGLGQLGATPQIKQAEVSQATQQKKAELGLPSAEDLANIATGTLNPHFQNKVLPLHSETARDLAGMDPVALLHKYGSQAGALLSAKLAAEAQYGSQANSARDYPAVLKDSAIDVASGFVNPIAGIVDTGLGLVNADAGVGLAKGITQANEWAQQQQSDALNLSRKRYAADQALSSAINADQETQDKASGDGDLVAGLKRIGRDTLEATHNSLDNLGMLQSVIANAGGSLLAAGPVGKAAGLALKPLEAVVDASPTISRLAAVGAQGPRQASELIRAAAMPAAIGAMEGGGAYQQTASQAADMGASNDAANRAGLEAAAVDAPLAVATAPLVAGFEKAPFHVVPAGEALGNMAKEGVEEFLQSGGGQFAQNLGIHDQVDPNQSLVEGVGEQAAQGALGGALSAGVVEAPGTAVHALGSAIQAAPGAALAAATSIPAIKARAAQIQAETAAASPVSEANADAKIQAALDLPPASTTAAPVMNEETPTPAAAPAAPADAVSPAAPASAPEAVVEATPLQAKLAEVHDKLGTVMAASRVANDPQTPDDVRMSAGRVLLNFQQNHAQQLADELIQAAGPLDETQHADELGQLQTYMNAINAAQGQNHPRIAAAIELAKTTAAKPETLTTALKSPTTAQAHADTVAELAAHDPESVNPEVVDELIRQHSVAKGPIKLTDEQLAILKAASALVRANKDRLDAAKSQGLSLDIHDSVSAEAQNTDKGSKGWGAAKIARAAIEAYKSGDTETLQAQMRQLKYLAEHMQRKLGATNQSVESGQPAQYSALKNANERPVGVDQRNEKAGEVSIWRTADGTLNKGSLRHARSVANDARAVTELYNGMHQAFSGSLAKTDRGEVKQGELHKLAQTEGPKTVEAKIPVKDDVTQDEPVQSVETKTTQEDGRPYKELTDQDIRNYDMVDEPPRSEEAVLKDMTEKMSPKEFVTNYVEGRRSQDAGVIDHKGRLRLITNTEGYGDDPNGGAHTALFSALKSATRNWLAGDDYIKVTTFLGQVATSSHSAELNEAQQATLRALKSMTERVGGTYIGLLQGAEPKPAEVVGPAPEPVAKMSDSNAATSSEPVQERTQKPKPFQGLLGSAQKLNRFLQAFRLPKTETSRLTHDAAPIETATRAFTSESAFQDVLGSAKLNHKLTPELLGGYQDLLRFAEPLTQALDARLQSFLNKVGSSKKSNRELLLAGEGGITDWLQGRVTNLTTADGDQVGYHQTLLQAAALAGLNWVANAAVRPQQHYDDEAVALVFGLQEYEVTDKERDILNKTLSQDEVIQALASSITKFWGVKAKSTEGQGYTKGIPEAMAAELLLGMQDLGLVKHASEKVNQQDWGRISVIGSENLDKMYQSLVPFPGAIEQLAVTHPEQTNYIGEAPTEVAKTQANSPLIENSESQQAVIAKQQAMPRQLDRVFAGFLEAIEHSGAKVLWGGGNFADRTVNVNHAKSLEGQNRTVDGGHSTAMQLLAELRNREAATGVPAHEQPIFYKWNFIKNGRLAMLGAYTPQSSKVVRAMVTAMRSTLDLTDPRHNDVFNLALAQAWGEKIHQMDQVAVNAKVQNLVGPGGKLAPVIAKMLLHLDGKPLSLASLSEIRQALGKDCTPVALMAALEFARSTREDPKAFETHLYVEADGVTNGVVNALVHLATGVFDAEWIHNVAKGGLTFTAKATSLADYLQTVPETGPRDLYAVGSSNAQQVLNREVEGYQARGQRGVSDHLANLLGLMQRVLPDGDLAFDTENQTLTIGRGSMKNPMTVSLYGSGERGIAAKVTAAVLKGFYAQMTAAAEGTLSEDAANTLVKVMNQLTSHKVWVDDGRVQSIKADRHVSLPGDQSFQAYTLTASQKANLSRAIEKLYVKGLKTGIDATNRHTLVGRSLVQKTLQAQSVFGYEAFKAAVNAAVAAQGDESHPQTFLSDDQLLEIQQKLANIFPIVEMNGIKVFVSGESTTGITTSEGKNGQKNYRHFGESLSGGLSSKASIFAPSDAGVAGIPYITIAFGDGMMIKMLAEGDNAPGRMELIFDGVHLPLSDLAAQGATVNQAVQDSWKLNPLAAVQATFDRFMAQADLGNMSEAQVAALAGALFSPEEQEGRTLEEVIAELEDIQAQMTDAATSAAARKTAMAQVATSTDQMAGIGAPHLQGQGLDLRGLTAEAQADVLNALYHQALGREGLSGAEVLAQHRALMADPSEVKAEPAVQAELPAPQTDTVPGPQDKFVVRDAFSGASVIGGKNLAKWVNSLKTLPTEQKNLMKEIVRSLNGWEVVVGDDAQVRAYATMFRDAAPTAHPGRETQGWTSTKGQRIYLAQRSAETALHELIHAAVTQKILGYYADPLGAPHEVRELVQKLEGLLAQWQTLDVAVMEPATRAAYQNAKGQIDLEQGDVKRQPWENQAAALDEFLAWTLSNRELIAQAKQTAVANPVLRVVKTALAALKALIWGQQSLPAVKGDLYSSLRFHTSLLINNSAPSLATRLGQMASRMHSIYGADPRISDQIEAFTQKLAGWVHAFPDGVEQAKASEQVEDLKKGLGADVAEAFMDHGWAMTGQQRHLFEMMIATFATSAKLDPLALAQAQTLYDHVVKVLTQDPHVMVDPRLIDEDQRNYDASQKLNAILGVGIQGQDAQKRSTLLPAFLALAAVNDDFRKVLQQIDLPKAAKISEGETFNDMVLRAGNSVLTTLTRVLSGQGKNQPHVQAAIEALTNRVAATVDDQEQTFNALMNPVGTVFEQANEKLAQGLKQGSKTIQSEAEKLHAFAGEKLTGDAKTYAQGALRSLQLVAMSLDSDHAANLGESALAFINRVGLFEPLHKMVADIVGQTKSNVAVHRLLKLVRSYVQQVRQQYRDRLPELINSKFTDKPSDEQYSHLFHLAKIDLASLAKRSTAESLRKTLLDPDRVAAKTATLESLIKSELNDPKAWTQLQGKVEQLAHYMVTEQAGEHLLSNAYAIAKLYRGARSEMAQPSEKLISAVDQLATLYALDKLPSEVRETLSNLSETEKTGMTFLLDYLIGQRKGEQEKLSTEEARLNHYKGYVPSEPQKGLQLTVAKDSEYARLTAMGFKRVADYKGHPAEVSQAQRGYYYAPLASKAPFNQSILQYVRETASGVDPATGFSVGPMTAGQIVNPRVVQAIARTQVSRKFGGEALRPVFNAHGQVVAYERMMDPNQLQRLDRDTHLARMIGVWRGRQVEEQLGGEFNAKLIGAMAQSWTQNRQTEPHAYVNLLDSETLDKDLVIADAVRLFTPQIREQIRDAYGEDGGFWVRKDMIDDAIGYRSPSVGDFWTGTTRWSPKTQEQVRTLATGLLGKDAFKILAIGEHLTQNLVTEAKQTIVVRSMVVPAANIIANLYQGISLGISPAFMAKRIPVKVAEAHAYLQRRMRQTEIEVELRATHTVIETRRLQTELQTILDANQRMSIWPLIQSGELASISAPGSLERESLSLFEANIEKFIEHQINKLPNIVGSKVKAGDVRMAPKWAKVAANPTSPGSLAKLAGASKVTQLQTLAKYALISKDTALFQGLQKTLEYGDFVAKAVTYDHLMEKKGYSSQEALDRVREEFVNYDRLPGRYRGYLESMGGMWFWNYKIRAAKIAVNTVRDNPLYALMAALAPTPHAFGMIGTPLSDNLLTQLLDGQAFHSIGPGMWFRSHRMNPILSMFHG